MIIDHNIEGEIKRKQFMFSSLIKAESAVVSTVVENAWGN